MGHHKTSTWDPLWDEEAQLPPSYSVSASPPPSPYLPPTGAGPSTWQNLGSALPGTSASHAQQGADIPMLDQPSNLQVGAPPAAAPISKGKNKNKNEKLSLSDRMLLLASTASTTEERIAATNIIPAILDRELAQARAIVEEKQKRVQARNARIRYVFEQFIGPPLWFLALLLIVFGGIVALIKFAG